MFVSRWRTATLSQTKHGRGPRLASLFFRDSFSAKRWFAQRERYLQLHFYLDRLFVCRTV